MSEWNKKRRIMRRYDQSVRVYDTQYSEEQKAKIRTAMSVVDLNENSFVLDAGCGTGLLFAHVAEKSKFTVGTDISSGILKQAQKKAKLYTNVALVLADADNMPFPNQVFDAVFAVTLLQNTPNPRVTLDEIKRVSKSNAAVVVTGLRKTFTKENFVKTLTQANLKVLTLKLDEHMREYVSVCVKMRR